MCFLSFQLYLSKITELYFDFQVRCFIYISGFLWFHGKLITSALREAGRSSAREEAADGGDEEEEGILGYLCLLYDSQPHPTQQYSVASFVTVAASAKSGLSNGGTTADLSSHGILN